MMQTLRNNMKIIMWIVALTFIGTIVFSWGMGGFKRRGDVTEQGIIGSVNGERITYQQFAQMLDEEYRRVREQEKAEDLSEYRRNQIRDQVWQNYVRERLLAREVARQGITASPEEVVFFMRNAPPEFVRNSEQFQTDGQFDQKKYIEALSDARYYQAWTPVESYFRSAIPVQKLQQSIIASVRVSDGEAETAYRMENAKVNVKYVFFDPARAVLDDPTVTDKAIASYYKSHQKEYEEPEQRKIQYVRFEIRPTAEDSAGTKADARDILAQIREGADFAEMARDYSEDKSNAENGGDLGFIRKGTMVKPFEDAVFSARPGDLLGPVETPFGLHLIKVSGRKLEKGETTVQASHILLTFKTSQESQESINQRSEFFVESLQASKGEAFKEIAEGEGQAAKETPLFRKGSFIPGIGLAPRVNHMAFANDEGWLSPPVYMDNAIIVFRVLEIQKARVKPIEDLKTAIEGQLRNEKLKDATLNAARAFRTRLQSAAQFETEAARDSLDVRETGFFTALGYIPQLGRDPAFSATAFKLKPGQISDAVEGSRGAYVLMGMAEQPADMQAYEAQKAAYSRQLLQGKQNQFYSAWMKDLMDKAKIEDYRDWYY
jgi:peptidyl-prolyl cis-trans isomerase D